MADQQTKEKGKESATNEEERLPNLEERLVGMKLQGEEEEDLDLSGELKDLVKDVRWLALFRVHTSKPFSHAALFSALRNAWAAAQGVTFKSLGPNLFLAQLHCLGDWSRVTEGSPWLFRGSAIVMEEYDGFSNVLAYKLDRIPIWARIQGLPEGLMKKRELAEKVAKKVGESITVVVNEGKINSTPYLRARVWLDLKKPLVRVVPITLKEKMKFLVQYEKLPAFCYFCGCLGHDVTECGNGIHSKDSCEWGDWLCVPFVPMMGRDDPRGGGGRGRGRGRGRGGGRGAGVEDEIDDMDTSLEYYEAETTANELGQVAMQTNLLEPPQKDATISPIKEQEKKRPRKNGGEEDNELTKTNARSALSFEESGRAQ
jgi:hypothetical protein